MTHNFQLNEDQKAAIAAVVQWLADDSSSMFTLYGSAGVGKTTTMRELAQSIEGRVLFTAPTNKATKVLRETLANDDYTPECSTIYSALGLVLDTSGEFREIVNAKAIDLTKYAAIIVDESSMVGGKLWPFLEIAMRAGIKFVFVGDRAQLPPVKEGESTVFSSSRECPKFELTKVVRHDNNILLVSQHIRRAIDLQFPKLNFGQFAGNGVRIAGDNFEQLILADPESFLVNCKVVAWRNVMVAHYNKILRQAIYGKMAKIPFLATERVVFAAPVAVTVTQKVGNKVVEDRRVLAHTDEEGIIESVEECPHPNHDDILCFQLTITVDCPEARRITAYALHPKGKQAYSAQLNELEGAARMKRSNWKYFWQFREDFHDIRPAYAITAHRSQGSTYRRTFVNWQDILSNPNRTEAIRCLYVACTRPREELILS